MTWVKTEEQRQRKRLYNKRYKKEHQEKTKEEKRSYCLRNKEKISDYQKKYYLANKERILARQRANRGSILNKSRAWHKKNKGLVREQKKRYKEKYPEKVIAHRAGVVVRKMIWMPQTCSKCGKSTIAGMQGHHPDYNQPFYIVWVCKDCHKEIHRERRIAG